MRLLDSYPMFPSKSLALSYSFHTTTINQPLSSCNAKKANINNGITSRSTLARSFFSSPSVHVISCSDWFLSFAFSNSSAAYFSSATFIFATYKRIVVQKPSTANAVAADSSRLGGDMPATYTERTRPHRSAQADLCFGLSRISRLTVTIETSAVRRPSMGFCPLSYP